MASSAAKKQDMPPPGGYKTLNYSRVPAKSLISGKGLIAANLAITAGALYMYSINHRQVEKEDIEVRSSIFAITPLLLAERDREYLKQLRRNRDAEEKLMANVEGWEVGKYQGENIYKTIPEDRLVKPSLSEYLVHHEPKWFEACRHAQYWD